MDTDASPAPVITDDRPCLRCGYSLRGLSETGVCPECGMSVADSLRGNLLAFADPAFLRTLVRGARLVWWSVVLLLVAIVTSVGVVIVISSFHPGAVWLFYLFPAMSVVVGVMAVLGWWLLSAPNPAESERRGVVSRRVLRITVAAWAGCLLLSTALALVGASAAGGVRSAGPAIRTLSAFTATGAYVAWAVQVFASMAYVTVLAGRIPDPKLAARARIVEWVAVFLFLLILVAFLGRFVPGSDTTAYFSCGASASVLALLVVYMMAIDRLKLGLVKVQEGGRIA